MSNYKQKNTHQPARAGNMPGAQAFGNTVGTQVSATIGWLKSLWYGSDKSTDSEDDAQKIKEVDELLDEFAPNLEDSIVADCFTKSELERLANKQPEVEPDLLDGSFVLVDLEPNERRDLRAELGLSDPVQREIDKEEGDSILFNQSIVLHRGRNYSIAPRPSSVKVPPSNVVDPNSIGKPYERIPEHERTTEDTKSQVRRVRVAEQGSLQGGRVTTLLTVKTCSP